MSKTHGQTGSPTYRSWWAMIQRCEYKRATAYPDYGGRGIRVCQRWRESFEMFLADMGYRPPGTSLDRYPDNNGHYEPGNCRWATAEQQRANQERGPVEPREAPTPRTRRRPRAEVSGRSTERFMIRCTPGDLERWRIKAAELGLTTGQWLRMLAHKAEQR